MSNHTNSKDEGESEYTYETMTGEEEGSTFESETYDSQESNDSDNESQNSSSDPNSDS